MLHSFTNNEIVHYEDKKEHEAKEHTNKDTHNNKQEIERKTNIKLLNQRSKNTKK
jgi:hypothetical protein